MSISILCIMWAPIIECRCYTCVMILSLVFFVFCFCFMKTPTCILNYSSTLKSSIRSTINSGSTFARRVPIALSSSSNFSRTSPTSLNLYHPIFMLEFLHVLVDVSTLSVDGGGCNGGDNGDGDGSYSDFTFS